jgi:hypothetical protein
MQKIKMARGICFFGGFGMKKMKLNRGKSFSGCELYLNNCKERNLREGTIKHYRQSYDQFYKLFDNINVAICHARSKKTA